MFSWWKEIEEVEWEVENRQDRMSWAKETFNLYKRMNVERSSKDVHYSGSPSVTNLLLYNNNVQQYTAQRAPIGKPAAPLLASSFTHSLNFISNQVYYILKSLPHKSKK